MTTPANPDSLNYQSQGEPYVYLGGTIPNGSFHYQNDGELYVGAESFGPNAALVAISSVVTDTPTPWWNLDSFHYKRDGELFPYLVGIAPTGSFDYKIEGEPYRGGASTGFLFSSHAFVGMAMLSATSRTDQTTATTSVHTTVRVTVAGAVCSAQASAFVLPSNVKAGAAMFHVMTSCVAGGVIVTNAPLEMWSQTHVVSWVAVESGALVVSDSRLREFYGPEVDQEMYSGADLEAIGAEAPNAPALLLAFAVASPVLPFVLWGDALRAKAIE